MISALCVFCVILVVQSVILTNTHCLSLNSLGVVIALYCAALKFSSPLHRIHIQSKLITGFFPIAVCPALPINGVTLLLGNDITGGKVTPGQPSVHSQILIGIPCFR